MRSSAYDTIISVVIGPEEKVFQIHRGALRYHSDYFHGALRNDFKDTSPEEIRLKDMSVEDFEVFKGWLYTKQIPGCPIRGGSYREMARKLVRYWILGDFLIAPAFKNAITDTILASVAFAPSVTPFEAITEAYANTSEDSGLRKLMVDVVVSIFRDLEQWAREAKEQWADKIPSQFLLDVIIAKHAEPTPDIFLSRTALNMVIPSMRCKYHDHEFLVERPLLSADDEEEGEEVVFDEYV